MRSIIAVAIFLSLTITAERATAQLIIGHYTNGNANPFTSPLGTLLGPSNRYQQVYASSSFPGVSTIGAISFFDTPYSPRFPVEVINADYDFYFSTSKFRVDNLDEVNLDINPGDDAKLFTTIHLGGSIGGPVLTITGNPFTYDPSLGDLLIDIRVSNVVPGDIFGFFDAMGDQFGAANGLFSRAQNFSLGNKGYGLVTGFTLVPEPSTLTLLALGVVGTAVMRRRGSPSVRILVRNSLTYRRPSRSTAYFFARYS